MYRKPEEITHNGVTLAQILADHALWLRDEGANLTRANLIDANLTDAYMTGANMTGANLTRANLIDANLTRANLTRADLTGANLTRANLTRANLTDAYMTGANMTGADLTGANLTRANLTRANLTDAYMTRANLTDARLWGAIGNMAEVKSMQIERWPVTYTASTLQIGCERHHIAAWREASPEWIARMDPNVTDWWAKFGPIILGIIDASPATPTGHEK